MIRSKHSDHCNKCDVCVNYRHKHSKLFGRCIGSDNSRSYIMMQASSLLLISLLILLILTSSTTCFQGFFTLWDYSLFWFLVTVALIYFQISIFEDLLWLGTALARALTLRELQNVWAYKRCFDVHTTDDSEMNQNSEYINKKVSLLSMCTNIRSFLQGDAIR